jgi:hypothetical protein
LTQNCGFNFYSKKQRSGQRTFPEPSVLFQLIEETLQLLEKSHEPGIDSYFTLTFLLKKLKNPS